MQMQPLSHEPQRPNGLRAKKKLALSRETLQILNAAPLEDYENATHNGTCPSLSCVQQCTGANTVCICNSDASCADTCKTGPLTVCF